MVTETGAPSETRYEVIAAASDDRSLVRCELVTGRTHQIRVHLASRGWPIVGDALYGLPHETMTRQALHAWRCNCRIRSHGNRSTSKPRSTIFAR